MYERVPVSVAFVPEAVAALLRGVVLSRASLCLSRPELWSEAALLDRLLYKSRSQHRGSRHFDALQLLCRRLRLLKTLRLQTTVSLLSTCLPSSGGFESAILPCSAAAAHVCRRLLAGARMCVRGREAAVGVACECDALLASSYFMPFAVVALSLSSRCAALLGQLATDCCTVHNALAVVVQSLPSPAFEGALPALLTLDWAAPPCGVVRCHGTVVIASSDDTAALDEGICVVRASTGLVWEQRAPEEPVGVPARTGGMLCVVTSDRPLYTLSKAEKKPVRRSDKTPKTERDAHTNALALLLGGI